MRKKDKSLAFTLAEALLTITIIGVTVALMMRSINRVSPDKEKILFIKTYHAIEQVIANTINDPTKYDPNYYDEALLSEMSDDEKKDLRSDFAHKPLETAKVHINDKELKGCDKKTNSGDDCLHSENAMCYFLADGLNTIGDVNCQNNDNMNFKTSTGVCFYDWVGMKPATNDSMAYNDPKISPTCDENNKYVINVYADGKVTVPSTHTTIKNQSTAYNWMNDQTNIK